MENKTAHAQLTISLDKHVVGLASPLIKCEVSGCRQCLKTAITILLLNDPKFKELMNECIRAANEIKGRAQN
jgi:hypothetical protein